MTTENFEIITPTPTPTPMPPEFGPLDIIGKLFATPDADENAPTPLPGEGEDEGQAQALTPLPGWHVNSPWPIAAFADKQVHPSTPRRVFAGGQTVCYTFASKAEFMAALDGADLSQPVVVPVPQVVSRFQARAALHNAGLFPAVEALMAHEDTPMVVKLAWTDAQEFRRTSPTVQALAGAMNLTDEQVDALFVAAAGIEA